MRAAIFNEPRSITAGERPDPSIVEPTDAIVRVVLACVCGSDLWYYRGDSPFEPGPIGHEFIGVVEDVGADLNHVVKGDLVIAPFAFSDGSCPNCANGITTACMNGGFFPMNGDGGQGEAVRVPLAETTLVTVPGSGHSDEMLRSLLSLSDVMGTGHHAAVCAQVKAGQTVAVVGDGAVGLSGVLAAKRLGADRIIALSRHADRQQLAKDFGATDIVAERGEEAVAAAREMTDGVGVDATLECVGTGQAMETAIGVARAGSTVGFVGVPHGVELPIQQMFFRNIGVRGGGAPVRVYLPELLEDVLAEREPGPRPGLRDRPGGHRRRLRRHGRAPRDQVAGTGGERLMAAWTEDELRRIAGAQELEIAPVRRSGELRRATPIWVVRAADDLYIRSAYGADKGWHGVARSSHQAHIRAGGVAKVVVIDDADDAVLDEVDVAYREKYGRRYASIVDTINDAEHRATTLRLVPPEAG
jgi:threonine dehydrogenase-like Zn-dependent dehydrogenase